MKYLLSLAAFVGVVAILGVFKVQQIQAAIALGASMAPPPPAVSTFVAAERPWPSVLESIGTLRAEQGVVLAAEAEGVVREILFESGARVEAGQVLIRLDRTVEEAELAAASAREELARAELARARELRERGVNSSADLDLAVDRFRGAIVAAPYAHQGVVVGTCERGQGGQGRHDGDAFVHVRAGARRLLVTACSIGGRNGLQCRA